MQSVLIANRGEIAVRIIRSARELGVRTIAVYSEIDRDAEHVALADEAWNIGPAPAADSYLNAERIIDVARESGADAVHPGYGFLAENALFAQAVVDAGVLWVGPSPKSISTMGDKIASRRAAEAAGVSGVPGTPNPVDDAAEVVAFAEQSGYPVAIKAAHGGGGKGLKVVHSADEVGAAFESAQREADAYFRNPAVYVERYLDKPRHIEAQIMADAHGRIVFLGERDCTIQRRHQKLIEETPAFGISDEMRRRIGEAATAVAEAADYVNAGTVEFLVDGDSFYFLEMNTRIQVEHTVTEMVTGLDLVELMMRAASGEKLPMAAGDVSITGHAIEARILAEDAGSEFAPQIGTIHHLRVPSTVRWDAAVDEGSEITPHYDSLLAKVIAHAETRSAAIETMLAALASARIHASDEIRDMQGELCRLIEYANHRAVELGLPLLHGEDRVPIRFIGLGPQAASTAMATHLLERGLLPSCALFPAVPADQTGIRFTVTRHHEASDLDLLLETIADYLPEALSAGGVDRAEVDCAFGLKCGTTAANAGSQ